MNLNQISALKTAFAEEINKGKPIEITTKEQAVAFIALANSGNTATSQELKEKAFQVIHQIPKEKSMISNFFKSMGSIFASIVGAVKPVENSPLIQAIHADDLLLFYHLIEKTPLSYVEKTELTQKALGSHSSIDMINALFSFCSDTEIKSLINDNLNLLVGHFQRKKEQLKNFNLYARCEFGKCAAQAEPWQTVENIQYYGFDPNTPKGFSALLEIGEVLAAENGQATSAYVKELGFDPKSEAGRDALLKIGKISAAKNPAGTIENIRYYGFDPKTSDCRNALLEIATAARNKRLIEIFSLLPWTQNGMKRLIEIAKNSAAEYGARTSRQIQIFGFDPKTPQGHAALFEIAKLSITQDLGQTSLYIQNYGFDPKTDEGFTALFEIAKISAALDGALTSKHIKNYGFDPATTKGFAALLEIGKISAAQNGLGTSLNIKNYGFDPKKIDDRAALLEIGKIAIPHTKPTEEIYRYGFDYTDTEGQKAMIELILLYFRRADSNISQLSSKILYPIITRPKVELPGTFQKFVSALNLFKNASSIDYQNFTDSSEKLDSPEKLEVILSTNFKDLPIIETLLKEAMKFPKFAKEQALTTIAYIVLNGVSLDKQEILAKWQSTFEELILIRDPKLRMQLVHMLFYLINKFPDRPPQALLEATLQSLYEKKEFTPPKSDKPFLDQIKKKDIKDADLKKTLLWTLVELFQDDNVKGLSAYNALQQAVKADTRTKITHELSKIRALINLKGVKLLETKTVNEALEEQVKAKYPAFASNHQSFSDDLSKTFLASRNPFGIFTYAARLATDPGLKTEKPLGSFFNAVLNGTFKQERQKTDYNIHLQELKENHPEILENWFKGCEPVEQEITKKKDIKLEESVKIILYNALVRDAHFKGVHPSVTAVLRGELDVKVAIQKFDSPQDEINLGLLKLIDGKEPMIHLVERIRKKISEKEIDTELDNDLKQFLPKKTAALDQIILRDTDDPYDLFYCGSEVDGSCQSLEGNPLLNQGLLGYLLNGQTRLLTLKRPGENGLTPITARAIVRLLLNENDNPVLLIERIYPQLLAPELKEALIEFAMKRATDLGVELVSVEEGDRNSPYPEIIKNLGGVVPEYVDSAGGIQYGGYFLTNAHKIYQD